MSVDRAVREWVHGWALTRGTPAPVEEPDGYRVDVGLPGHRVRYVLPDVSTVDERCAALTAPGTWLKICGSPAVPPQWTVGGPEYLMGKDLFSPQRVSALPGYRVSRSSDGVVVRAADGSLAAAGRFAVWGEASVVDQVVTEPAHRRKGLGSVVMSELDALAVELGAVRAVLVATEDGLALYRRLGWAVLSPVTAAHLPGRL
ncbi:GNAT family N-acetyltransferase [Allokutzneria albata]|uniref:GNAT family N-acetyltransferase n=1 Tax=Allokutzneria albata TaxID=211114 RepID=UPI000B0E2509|nr:GNAT family N-acetyltransferase [Allokutzneria albata]